MSARASVTFVLVAVALATCTSPQPLPSPTDPTAPPTTVAGSTTTTQVAMEAVTAYQGCLEENGVSIETIPYDANGRPRLELVMTGMDLSDGEVITALTSCSSHLSTGALDLSDDPALMDEVNGLLSSFSVCVRDHGVEEFPDPIAGFTGVGGPYPLAEIPYDDPDIAEAIAICRDRLE